MEAEGLSTKLNLGGFFTVRSASAFPEIGRTEKGRRICSNGPSGFKNDFEMKNAPPRLCVPYNQLGFAVESKNPFHQRNKAAVAEQTHDVLTAVSLLGFTNRLLWREPLPATSGF